MKLQILADDKVLVETMLAGFFERTALQRELSGLGLGAVEKLLEGKVRAYFPPFVQEARKAAAAVKAAQARLRQEKRPEKLTEIMRSREKQAKKKIVKKKTVKKKK